MGKKVKKTRWRTLALNGHQSDSEESNPSSSLQNSKAYQPKYSKFPYSSQSTPIKKFQHENGKSTRSNSTTSEHKATFNEDEYTRITTPRQDVLFKKGYLNKPKTYQTQTSTGTSSTANSTSTCTPDHQSADGTEGTDLEYESQFVFPNGFIDQNGIYYINSFEPFPFVVYNAPVCYPEYSTSRTKRYSTDSMTESMSPHNEEVGQDIVQNGSTDQAGSAHVFNQPFMQPFYYNEPSTLTNGQYLVDDGRKFKKRRRRKTSRNVNENESSEDTDDYPSSDEVFAQEENNKPVQLLSGQEVVDSGINSEEIPKENGRHVLEHSTEDPHHKDQVLVDSVIPSDTKVIVELNHDQHSQATHSENQSEDIQNDINCVNHPKESSAPSTQCISSDNLLQESVKDTSVNEPATNETETLEFQKSNTNDAQNLLLQSLLKNSEGQDELSEQKQSTYSLKPDAQEFIPRILRLPEALPFDPHIQFLNFSPSFFPVSFVNHLGEFPRPHFIPSRIQIPVPTQSPPLSKFDSTNEDEVKEIKASEPSEGTQIQEERKEPEIVETGSIKKVRNEIDIAKIVYKLEEAAKQQKMQERKHPFIKGPGKYIPKQYPPHRGRYINKYSYENNYCQKPRQNLEKHFEKKPRRPDSYWNNKSSDETQIKTEIKEVKKEVIIKRLETCVQAKELEEISRKNSVDTVTKQDAPQTQEKLTTQKERDVKSDSMQRQKPNYSETLKKKIEVNTKNCSKYEKDITEKVENNFEANQIRKPVIQSQWISVSSRKKRKNKILAEDTAEELEVKERSNDDYLFETFDVNMLEDVIPHCDSSQISRDLVGNPIVDDNPTKEDASQNTKIYKEQVIEFVEQQAEPCLNKADVFVVKVENIERKKKKSKKNQKSTTKKVIITDANHVIKPNKEANTIGKENDLTDRIEKASDIKKTAKNETLDENRIADNTNNAQETLTAVLPDENVLTSEIDEKATISKDTVDVSKTQDENVNGDTENITSEGDLSDGVNKIDENQQEIALSKTPAEILSSNTQTQSESETITGTPEKKSKKKKKKTKTLKVPSVSSSITTLNNLDESYDFLLENSVLEEFEQKTNVEISQELDRIIQKGLYSSLEEKLRSLNGDPVEDGFFEHVSHGFLQSSDKPELTKPPNFGKFVHKTPNADDQSVINIDFSKIKLPDLEPQPSTSKSGAFLDDFDDAKDKPGSFPLPDNTSNTDKSELKVELLKGENTTIPESNLTSTSNVSSSPDRECLERSQNTLYPITQAVKEWMTRTRENTPDAEILKSPNTIYKEFCQTDTETESESVGDSKNDLTSSQPAMSSRSASPKHVKVAELGEEVTIWSVSPHNSVEEDLLDCWEDELDKSKESEKSVNLNKIKETKGAMQNDCKTNGHIEEGEEAIEVYESKYGKNEDFLKLQKEIEEHKRNFPRHGDLPYRAICCSVM